MDRRVTVIADNSAIGDLYPYAFRNKEEGNFAKQVLERRGYDLRRMPFNHLAILGTRDGFYFGGVLAGDRTQNLGPSRHSPPSFKKDNNRVREFVLSEYLRTFRSGNVVLTYPHIKDNVIDRLHDLGCVVEVMEKSRKPRRD